MPEITSSGPTPGSKSVPLDKTLLIVGAGAHVPYNMPTGEAVTLTIRRMYKIFRRTFAGEISTGERKNFKTSRILQEVVNHAAMLPDLAGDMNAKRHAREAVYNFIERFSQSSAHTVDAYLATLSPAGNGQPPLEAKIGKLTLAIILHTEELKSRIGTQNLDWIEFITNHFIRNNLGSFLSNPPRIITFNYDRILERVLYYNFIHIHKKQPEEAAEMVRNLEIIHVYGDLGDFTFKPEDEVKEGFEFYKRAMENMQIVGADRQSSLVTERKKKSNEYIKNADRIYFLGYGFDTQNNSLLLDGLPRKTADNAEKWWKGKDLCTTNIRVRNSDKERISDDLGVMPWPLNDARISREIFCEDLIRDDRPMSRPKRPPAKAVRLKRTTKGFVTNY